MSLRKDDPELFNTIPFVLLYVFVAWNTYGYCYHYDSTASMAGIDAAFSAALWPGYWLMRTAEFMYAP